MPEWAEVPGRVGESAVAGAAGKDGDRGVGHHQPAGCQQRSSMEPKSRAGPGQGAAE